MTITMTTPTRTALCLLAALIASACSSGGGGSNDGESAGTGEDNGSPVDGGDTPTNGDNADTDNPEVAAFRQIQDTIFTPICAECHGPSGASAGLRLDEGSSFAAIVGMNSTEVPSLLRISAGDPDNSYLVQKIEGTAAVGARMPRGGDPLPQASIDLVRQWVSDGALPEMPSANSAAARVVSTSIDSSASLERLPGELTIVWSSPVDNASLDSSTLSLLRSGGDGSFGDGNEEKMALSVERSGNAHVTRLMITSTAPAATDSYQLHIRGDNDVYAVSENAAPIDGDSDGQAGGSFIREFTVESP